MEVYEKIKTMRELKGWTQEDVAEKLELSVAGYSKIERGKTKLNLDKLEQIAQLFNLDIIELLSINDKNICFLISENSQLSSNYYASSEATIIENEKLKLSLSHKEELLKQKDNEIASLKEIIALFKLQLAEKTL